MVYHVTDRYDLVVPGTDDPVLIASEDLPRFADTVDAALGAVDDRAAGTLHAARVYTDARTEVIERSRNLWDPSKVAYDHILSGSESSGAVVPNGEHDTSAFIPVREGQDYTIWGVIPSGGSRRGPRSWAFYDNNRELVSKGDDADAPIKTVTAPQDGFIRISVRKEVTPDPMVEEGSGATSYEPFQVTIPGLRVDLAEGDIPAGIVTPDKTSFAHTGKNILDPTEFLYDTFVQGGETAPLAGYTTSGMSPVEAGQPYVGVVRMWAWHAADGEYLGGLNTGSNTAVSVQTAPANAAFVRASWDSARNAFMQIEQGEAPTDYEPFGVFIPNLVIDGGGESTGGPMTVSLSSGQLNVSSGFGEARLTVSTALHGSANGGFNFLSANLGGAAVSVGTDDIAPIRTFNTVGANHGYTCISIITAAGKSTADLGSVWTDGDREFTLLLVDGDDLTFGHEYHVDSAGVVSAPSAGPAAPLVHVSGATNTQTIPIETRSGGQLYPSVQRIIVTPLVDGQAIGEGDHQGVTAQVREVYEVLDYRAIIDTARSNRGVPFHQRRVSGAVRVENIYTFKPGIVLVDTVLTELAPTRLGSSGIVQASRPAGDGGRIMPGVTGWTTPKPFADTWSSEIITSGDLIDANEPPTMSLDVMDWGGFALGYLPHTPGITSSTERIEHGGDRLWDLRSTQKSYPSPFAAKTAGWGRIEGHAYRAYLTPAQASGVAAVAGSAHAAHSALNAVTSLHAPVSTAAGTLAGGEGPRDTDWIDATPYLEPGITPSTAQGMAEFRRRADEVEFRFKLDLSGDVTSSVVAQLPEGFWSDLYQYLPGVYVADTQGAPASALAPFDGIPYVFRGRLQMPSSNRPPAPGTLVWQGRFEATYPFPSL